APIRGYSRPGPLRIATAAFTARPPTPVRLGKGVAVPKTGVGARLKSNCEVGCTVGVASCAMVAVKNANAISRMRTRPIKKRSRMMLPLSSSDLLNNYTLSYTDQTAVARLFHL